MSRVESRRNLAGFVGVRSHERILALANMERACELSKNCRLQRPRVVYMSIYKGVADFKPYFQATAGLPPRAQRRLRISDWEGSEEEPRIGRVA